MDKEVYNEALSLFKNKQYEDVKRVLENGNLDIEGKKLLLDTYLEIKKEKELKLSKSKNKGKKKNKKKNKLKNDDKEKIEKLKNEIIKSGDIDFLDKLTKEYIKEKKFDEIEKMYDDLKDQKIINDKTYLNSKLNLYKASGELNKAIETCDTLIRNYPSEGNINGVKEVLLEIKNKKNERMNNYLNNQKYDKVISELEGKYLDTEENKLLLKAYINTDTKSDKILDIISKILNEKNEEKLMIEAYEKLYSINPKNVKIITNLGNLYSETDQKDKVKKLFKEIREKNLSEDDEILKFKVELYEKEGNIKLADRWASTYLSKHPDDKEMLENKSKYQSIRNQRKEKNIDKEDLEEGLEENQIEQQKEEKNKKYAEDLKKQIEEENKNRPKEEEKKLSLKYKKAYEKNKYRLSQVEKENEIIKNRKREKINAALKNNQYYSAGMLAMTLKDYSRAAILLEQSIEKEGASARTYNAIGKAYFNMKDNINAKEAYSKAVKLDKKNRFKSITKLADVYMAEKMYSEAEYLYKKAIERNNKYNFYTVYEHSQLGTIYTEEGRYKDAEKHLKEGIEESAKKDNNLKDNVICKLKMSAMLAKQGHDEQAKKIYDDMLKVAPDGLIKTHKSDNTKTHIMKHTMDDKNKALHGVFNINPLEIYDKIDFSKLEKNPAYLGDIYCIPYENCGYQGGIQGDNRQLDYITIVTEPFSNKIITMYPSDKVEFKCKAVENKSNIEVLKKLVKENEELKQKEKVLDNELNKKKERDFDGR